MEYSFLNFLFMLFVGVMLFHISSHIKGVSERVETLARLLRMNKSDAAAPLPASVQQGETLKVPLPVSAPASVPLPRAATPATEQRAPMMAVPVPPPEFTAKKHATVASHAVSHAIKSAPAHVSTVPGQSKHVVAREQDGAHWLDLFMIWLKEDFIMKIGGFFILLGFIWFAKYQIDQGNISEQARLAMGMFVGIAVLAFGWMRMRAFFRQGSVFLVLGAMIFISTTYIGRAFYADRPWMYSSEVALGMMFMASAFISFVSVTYKNKALAVLSLVTAFVVPILANGNENYIGLFAYLYAVTLGAIWVIRFTGFRELIAIAATGVLIYSLPAIVSADAHIVLTEIYLFVATFFLASIAAAYTERNQDIPADQSWAVEVYVNTVGVMLLLWWVLSAGDADWRGFDTRPLILACWSVVFGIGGYITARIRMNSIHYYMHVIPAGIILGIATYVQFSDDAQILALLWTAEATAFVQLVKLRAARVSRAAGWSLVYIFPLAVLLSLYNEPFFKESGMMTGAFISFVLSLVMILVTQRQIAARLIEEKLGKDDAMMMVMIPFVLAVCHGLVGIWKVGEDFFKNQDPSVASAQATMFALVVYVVIGLTTMIRGTIQENQSKRWFGISLLSFVVAHLLLTDVWVMDVPYRIMTFIGIGVLFMSTTFIGRKKNEEHA